MYEGELGVVVVVLGKSSLRRKQLSKELKEMRGWARWIGRKDNQ